MRHAVFALFALATPAFAGDSRGLETLAPEVIGTNEELGVGSYRALLIAAQDYGERSGFPDLESPLIDTQRIGETLERQYGFEVVRVPNATRRDILESLDQLESELDEDDVLIVYYAGHGVVRTDQGRGFWIPEDATTHSSVEWVSTNEIASRVKALPVRHALVIADSCFSGEILRGNQDQPDTQAELALREARALVARRSRWVLTSGGNEPVLDRGAPAGMSVFAYALQSALTTTPDRYVTPDRLFSDVRRLVTQNSEQVPQQGRLKGSLHEGQAVLLNRNSCDGVLAFMAEQRDADAEQDWQAHVQRLKPDEDGYLEAVQSWIARHSNPSVTACGRTEPVSVARLADARQIEDRLLLAQIETPPQTRRPVSAPWVVGGGLVAAGGAALLGVSVTWRVQNSDLVRVDDNGVQLADESTERKFRTFRILNYAGGALLALGVTGVGIGVVPSLTGNGATVHITGRL